MSTDIQMPPASMASRLMVLSPALVIAHRGGSKLRPENTLLAFEHARALGVDALECDVHLSRDGDAVVIHDATLDRTTDASGPVSALTADELARADAGYGFGPGEGFPFRGKGAGVPRLSELLVRVPDLPVIVEIKGHDPRTAARVLEIVAECGAMDRVMIGGFSHAVLSATRLAHPGLITSASRDEVQSALRRSYLWMRPRRTGFDLFQVPLRLGGRKVLTRSFVRLLGRAGIPVQAWIIDEESDMRMLLEWGVSGLISDRPDIAIRVTKR